MTHYYHDEEDDEEEQRKESEASGAPCWCGHEQQNEKNRLQVMKSSAFISHSTNRRLCSVCGSASRTSTSHLTSHHLPRRPFLILYSDQQPIRGLNLILPPDLSTSRDDEDDAAPLVSSSAAIRVSDWWRRWESRLLIG